MSKFTDKTDLVYMLLDYMKKNNITNNYKEKLFNIIIKLPKKTDLQKDRFIRYYGLKPMGFKRENLSAIAREQHCTPNAVRSSVNSVRIALTRISDDDLTILKEIHDKVINN